MVLIQKPGTFIGHVKWGLDELLLYFCKCGTLYFIGTLDHSISFSQAFKHSGLVFFW